MAMEKLERISDEGTETLVAVAGHPLHPMLVTFPIAFLLGALATDVAFWLVADPFWARASLWLAGAGTAMGLLAGIAGAVETLSIAGIRRRGAAWSHFVVAVMMLSVSFTNWIHRLPDPEAAVVPTGLYLSALTALLVAVAGWMGGKLVFEHKVGTISDDGD